MIKVKILSIGKTKETWLEEAIAEYDKRLKGKISFEFVWLKNDEQLLAAAEKEASIIGLDPEGKMFSSEDFAAFFQQQIILSGSKITFIIGGAEGLPKGLKTKTPLISLSPMTFTHQMTRLLLIEQVYRATEILKGSNYHK